jgi:glyoxylase-like metal-dependent hydrolase (beta-lactamase superfamily II)
MPETTSIEHTTFGLMGPIVYTATRVMPIHCVIFQIGERIVLLDSGFGTREMLEPNTLLGDDVLWRVFPLIDVRLTALERLKARGIRPEQVTDIILTHMDYDHAGGLYDFPSAMVHVSKEEVDAFDSARPRGAYRRYQVSHQTKIKTYEATGEHWFGLEARSLELPGDLKAKLVPLPGHTSGHCGVAYREGGQWSLHAGDAYFDSRINFLDHPPGLSIEIGFQTSAADRQASLAKLKTLRTEHADEINLFCTHDQQEFVNWTSAQGKEDPISGPFVDPVEKSWSHLGKPPVRAA